MFKKYYAHRNPLYKVGFRVNEAVPVTSSALATNTSEKMTSRLEESETPEGEQDQVDLVELLSQKNNNQQKDLFPFVMYYFFQTHSA